MSAVKVDTKSGKSAFRGCHASAVADPPASVASIVCAKQAPNPRSPCTDHTNRDDALPYPPGTRDSPQDRSPGPPAADDTAGPPRRGRHRGSLGSSVGQPGGGPTEPCSRHSARRCIRRDRAPTRCAGRPQGRRTRMQTRGRARSRAPRAGSARDNTSTRVREEGGGKGGGFCARAIASDQLRALWRRRRATRPLRRASACSRRSSQEGVEKGAERWTTGAASGRARARARRGGTKTPSPDGGKDTADAGSAVDTPPEPGANVDASLARAFGRNGSRGCASRVARASGRGQPGAGLACPRPLPSGPAPWPVPTGRPRPPRLSTGSSHPGQGKYKDGGYAGRMKSGKSIREKAGQEGARRRRCVRAKGVEGTKAKTAIQKRGVVLQRENGSTRLSNESALDRISVVRTTPIWLGRCRARSP